MWYYKKDGNIIGPASARKIASMRKLGIITDSTPVSKKKNAKIGIPLAIYRKK